MRFIALTAAFLSLLPLSLGAAPPPPPPGGPSGPAPAPPRIPRPPPPRPIVEPTPDFTNITIFAPPSSWSSKSTSYARTVVLRHDCSNTILASFTFSPPNSDAALPVFQSKDNGRTWTELSRIYFKNGVYSGGAIWQPFLYELPEAVGKFPAGTILASGNGIPRGFGSTNIEVHASLDKGKTWQFVSQVAQGTAPNTNNGAHPIWEPFLLYHQGQLGVFYSDQRDPLHGQKLAHQASSDLINWGPVVNDVAMTNYTLRPGMTTITKFPQNGKDKFILSYEIGLANGPVEYAVGYRISDSPFTFDSAPDIPLVATDGTVSAAGPYIVWSPAGGPNGTLVLSDSTYAQVFTNDAHGDPRRWVKREVARDQGVSYTRSLTVLPDKKGKKILFANGGYYGLRAATVTAGEWVVPGDEGVDEVCVPGA